MNVIDFKMVYYNPWDAQYLGYLVMDYPDEEYAAEVARLRNYPSTDYRGIFCCRKNFMPIAKILLRDCIATTNNLKKFRAS